MTSMTDLDLHPAFESTEPLIQCEIVTPAASQPSDSVTNLRFLSENIDQHAFSGQLPSSFSENMPPLRENTSHSSSYREPHTISGDNYWMRVQSQSTTILLISIILITYLVLLRRFLLKHWRKIVSWFLIVVNTSLISIVSYYCNFHYTLFHMLRPRVYPTIRRLKALWDVTGPLIVIFLARRQHRGEAPPDKGKPLVLVQNVESTSEIRQDLRELRRDVDRVLDSVFTDINVGVVRRNRQDRS